MKSLSFLLFAAIIQTSPSAKGLWDGTISLPGQELAFSATFTQVGNTWSGTFDIPAQGAKDVPVGALTVADNSVSFTVPGAGGPAIKMTIAADGKNMSGTLTQGGANFPIRLTWKSDVKPPPELEITDAGKLEGIWEGALSVGGADIRLIVRFANARSGAIDGFFASLDQGPGEILLSAIGFKNSELQFKVANIGASFRGTMNTDGTLINGTLSQGIAQPIVLKKQPKDRL